MCVTLLFLWTEPCCAFFQAAGSQESLIERPGPPPRDDLETDANKDGIPDGWYNAREMRWMTEGGAVGPHFVRLECTRPGRPARLSRAFGIDGHKSEAIVLGLWVRASNIQIGDREGAEPSLMIDFLGEQMRQLSRGVMGPWTHSVRDRWVRVAKRIPVPPGTKDAIMSVGLLGATGILDFDGLTVDLVPPGGVESTNLVGNGNFELGDPAPAQWIATGGARRVFPGFQSDSAVELDRAKARLQTGLAIPIEAFEALDVSLDVRCAGLRGAGGAGAYFFFFDESGNRLRAPGEGEPFLRWAGSIGWHPEVAQVRVPQGAVRAVLQLDKFDSLGSIRIDNVRVTASPNPEVGAWSPFHIEDDTSEWLAVPPSPSIKPSSALDVSFLVPAPAGKRGFVTVKDGRLAFADGGRARFFGVSLLPPAAFLEPEHADELAERLARSGVNLVRLSAIDMALGPNRSLFDDTRDDTRAFDPVALARLDHLVAACKSRGIYVALELQSHRRFRVEDGVATPGLLPPGGGPAALFDRTIHGLTLETARSLLSHENTETGLALADDPALAWVVLAGEVSLFNLIDDPDALPASYAKTLRALAEKSTMAAGRRFWETLEAGYCKQMAEELRKIKVRVPIAGVSHWRRETEFVAAQAAHGIDLIEDRVYWSPPPWVAPEARSLLWWADGGLAAQAASKRRHDRPFAVGEWCNFSEGAWAYPHEAADFLVGAGAARSGDWDALVRRGVWVFPVTWGEGPAGTVGGEDIYQVPEVINGSPHVYALLPHAASILLRGQLSQSEKEPERRQTETAASRRRRPRSGWEPARGRFVIDTPFTQGVAGWFSEQPVSFTHLHFSSDTPFVVLVATSVTSEPIASTKRLLVSAVARVEPTGFRWVDSWKRLVADPGRPPFLQEPVKARIVWRRKGKVQAFVLDNAGERVGTAKLEPLPDGQGYALLLDGRTAAFHWELIAE